MPNTNKIYKAKSFFQKLRSDTAGNTIAMMAAALVPIAGIIGGGVDASRGYMVKARLQQACDAGVLAGRKAVGDGDFDQQANDRADALFNANFPANYQGSKNTTFVASSPNDGGLVEGVATTIVPTVVMKLLGIDTIELSAECNALLTISNADVTMVLDTTGSMSNSVSDGSGGTVSRINALRGAMANFYDILDEASSSSQARIRYGLVPYSMTVNVGRLLLADTSGNQLLMGQSGGDTVAYQSRRAVYEVEDGTTTTQTTTDTETFEEDDTDPALLTNANCQLYSDNRNFRYYRVNRFNGSVTTPDRSSTSSHTQDYDAGPNPDVDGDTTITYSFHSQGTFFNVNGETVSQCTRLVTTEEEVPNVVETYDGTLPGATFVRWEWGQYDWAVSDYIQSIDGGTDVPIPSRLEGDAARASWAGCIEERETVASDAIAYDAGSGQINPAGTFDLDIDLIPNNDATNWRPYWPEVSHLRNNNSTSYDACPQVSRLLSTMTRTEFVDYSNSLTTRGNTYHDVGLLWGARVSSEDGVFEASVNEAAPNNGFVSRHLIFMTDGVMQPTSNGYTIYGIENLDDRVRPGGAGSLTDRHNQRMDAVCAAIKDKGIRLWVIAFSTALTTRLENCASPNSSFVSTNGAELNQNFAEIAASIADLRLTK